MRSRFVKSAAVIALGILATFLLLPSLSAVAAAGSNTLTVVGLASGQSTAETNFDASYFSWSVDGSSSTTSSGAGTGKSTFNPLLVRHELKQAETLLIRAAAEGVHLPEVRLSVLIGDLEAVVFVLTDATVTRAELSGRASQPETSFAYRSVDVGVKGASYCFDIALSASC